MSYKCCPTVTGVLVVSVFLGSFASLEIIGSSAAPPAGLGTNPSDWPKSSQCRREQPEKKTKCVPLEKVSLLALKSQKLCYRNLTTLPLWYWWHLWPMIRHPMHFSVSLMNSFMHSNFILFMENGLTRYSHMVTYHPSLLYTSLLWLIYSFPWSWNSPNPLHMYGPSYIWSSWENLT